MQRDYAYEKANFVNNEEYYYCIKCKNHKVCNYMLPDRWYDVRGKYVCIPCEQKFSKIFNPNNNSNGELTFSDNVLCLQCNNMGEGVGYPDCDLTLNHQHYLCLHCFDNNWYSYNKIPEPIFPYNDNIKEEYFDNPANDKWKNYPLINIYEKQLELIAKMSNEIFNRYVHLRTCPVCKK